MKKLTDKKIKKIIQDCAFTIQGKEWRIFKKSDYYKWIKEYKESDTTKFLEFTLEDQVRGSAGQFLQAIRYLNLK
jgi:hypothetical protein